VKDKLRQCFPQFLRCDLKLGRDLRLVDLMPFVPSKKARQQQEKPKLCRISESLGELAGLAVDHDVKSQSPSGIIPLPYLAFVS
jgi:hypothetical protein